MKAKNLQSIIQAAVGKKNYPVVDLVKHNPEIAAIISKLVRPTDYISTYDVDGNRKLTNPDQLNFSAISQDIAQKSKDSDSVNELFPDMDLSAQILISSILSPKDMAGTELSIIAPNNLRSNEISSLLLSRIKDYFETDYKIEPLLPKILRQVLFETGSYPMVVIPESSVDQLINGGSKITTEGISELTDNESGTFKNIGILGNSNKNIKNKNKPTGLRTALESHVSIPSSSYEHFIELGKPDINRLMSVTDNPDLLKSKKIIDSFRKAAISEKLYKNNQQRNIFAGESYSTRLNDVQLSGLLYKSNRRGSINFTKVKTLDESSRKTIGAPLIMKLPSEAVIPVFTPGNEEDHVGYFVLLDPEGNPLSRTSHVDGYGDLQNMLNNSSNNMSSVLLNKAKNNFGSNCTAINVQQATKIYADIVESDLLARLRNGAYGSDLTIGRNEEVYRIMLSRVFKNQFTQLLYVPRELITYFAYKFDNRGIGKSLNDDMRILNSLRAMVLFSKVMASLKNSIGRTEVRLKLDERDANPQKTIETAMHEISKTRQQTFPLGMNSPTDLVDWVQKSGMEFTFSGHPGIPDVNIEFNEKSSNFVKPDNELEEDLRKKAIMSTGLSPETVDSGFGADFARTVVTNNILLAKRVMQIQDIFIPQISNFVKTIVFNHGGLVDDLNEIVSSNYDKVTSYLTDEEMANTDNKEMICNLIVSEFISNIEVTLPQPNSITLENQMSAFDAYVEALDKALNHYISSDIMSSAFVGESSDRVDEVKAIIKAYFCRKWLAENNVLPELAEMSISDEDGNPLLDFMQIHNDHLSGMTKSVVNFIKKQAPIAEAADKDLADVEETPPAEQSETDTTDSAEDIDGVDSTDTGIDTDELDDITSGNTLPNIDDIE